jgi:hypothetical protein
MGFLVMIDRTRHSYWWTLGAAESIKTQLLAEGKKHVEIEPWKGSWKNGYFFEQY